MGSYSINSGETKRLAEVNHPGEDYLLRVSGDDIRLSLSRNNADRGTVVFSGDRAECRVPPNSELHGFGEGGTTATVEVYPNGVNNRAAGDELLITYRPSSTVNISGSADVSDRAGRVLGRTRIADSSQTLIDDTNPFPVDIRDDNAGGVEVSDDGNFSATVTDSAHDNYGSIHTDSLTPSSSGQQFPPQSVNRGKTVVYRADPGNGSNIKLNDVVPIEAGNAVELDVRDVSNPAFFGDGSATIYAYVEVQT